MAVILVVAEAMCVCNHRREWHSTGESMPYHAAVDVNGQVMVGANYVSCRRCQCVHYTARYERLSIKLWLARA